MGTIIAKGAEATIEKQDNSVVKSRIKKNYRIEQIDDELRVRRTRSEAKILQKLHEFAPKVISVGKDSIEMEYIDGHVMKNILDDNIELAKTIGELTAKMHDAGIIHGDLTTSNIMRDKEKRIIFIDFGLSYVSEKIEDKAVDLHLFREALESKHFKFEKEIWAQFLKGYNPTNREAILQRLDLVEMRGRNKQKY
jgi:TP53 regulating kinase and related kinases